MLELYPALTPLRQGWLPVGHTHQLHWEVSGNPQGIPVVWLHGGPGSSASPLHRRFFDPDRFLIIQYDQRGCGKSLASERLAYNRTADLVDDLEILRQSFGLSTWSVVGGSWGGALALAYAQQHANVISQLLLRSPFLCSADEIDRFMHHPPSACLKAWQALAKHIPRSSTENLLDYGYRVFCQESDIAKQSALAVSWAHYEAAMNAFPEAAPVFDITASAGLIGRYQVQCHYLKNKCFVQREDLLHAQPLHHINLTIIHGEEDALCPIDNAWAIQALAPSAQRIILPGCGHELATQPMTQALLRTIADWSHR